MRRQTIFLLLLFIFSTLVAQQFPGCFVNFYASHAYFESTQDATANARMISTVQVIKEQESSAEMKSELRIYRADQSIVLSSTSAQDLHANRLQYQSNIDEHDCFVTTKQQLVDEVAFCNVSLLLYCDAQQVVQQGNMPCPNTTHTASYYKNGTVAALDTKSDDACLVFSQSAHPTMQLLSMKNAWIVSVTSITAMQWIHFLSKDTKTLLKQVLLVPHVVNGYCGNFAAPKIQQSDVYIFATFDLCYEQQIAFEQLHQLQHDTIVHFPINATMYTQVKLLAVYSLIQNQFVAFHQLDFGSMLPTHKYSSFDSFHVAPLKSFTSEEYKIVLAGSVSFYPQVEKAYLFTTTIREPFLELLNPIMLPMNISEKSSSIMTSQLHNNTMLLAGGYIDFEQAETGSIVTAGNAYLGLIDLNSMQVVAQQKWGTSGRNTFVSRIHSIDNDNVLIVQVVDRGNTHDNDRHQKSVIQKLRVTDLYHCVAPKLPDNTLLYIFLLGCGIVGIVIIVLVGIVFICRCARNKKETTYKPI